MSASFQKRTPVLWSEEEYLDREENAQDRHEFIDGQIYLMAGASPEHSLLCGNIHTALNNLCGQHCRVFTSDMRVRSASGRFYYPDVSAACGEPEILPAKTPRRTATLLNPTIIVEVLSPSTEEDDRGEKFRHYRTIPTLRDYILVLQDRIEVEHHARQADGSWVFRELRSGQRVRLPEGELLIDPLYRWVLT